MRFQHVTFQFCHTQHVPAAGYRDRRIVFAAVRNVQPACRLRRIFDLAAHGKAALAHGRNDPDQQFFPFVRADAAADPVQVVFLEARQVDQFVAVVDKAAEPARFQIQRPFRQPADQRRPFPVEEKGEAVIAVRVRHKRKFHFVAHMQMHARGVAPTDRFEQRIAHDEQPRSADRCLFPVQPILRQHVARQRRQGIAKQNGPFPVRRAQPELSPAVRIQI